MKKLLWLALPLLMLSCSSDSDSSSTNNSATVFIKGKLDGTTFDYSASETGTDYFYNTLGGFSGEGFNRWYYYGGSLYTGNPPTFTPQISIAWDNMVATDDETVETATFYSAFNTTPTNYLTSEQSDNHLKGVSVQYVEGQTFYESTLGSQAGSTFTVSSKVEGIEPTNGLQTLTITGTYSCKVYNSDDVTDFKTITNGSYKLILLEYN